ncbi:MAG: hypothetical protein KGI98_12025 [Euryarchaeota archaeon]|nr:hypothetical protein [Euryarchaeota archaeon]MDE1881197.1 hypothetical protein [Euryarchaeota archaeon]
MSAPPKAPNNGHRSRYFAEWDSSTRYRAIGALWNGYASKDGTQRGGLKFREEAKNLNLDRVILAYDAICSGEAPAVDAAQKKFLLDAARRSGILLRSPQRLAKTPPRPSIPAHVAETPAPVPYRPPMRAAVSVAQPSLTNRGIVAFIVASLVIVSVLAAFQFAPLIHGWTLWHALTEAEFADATMLVAIVVVTMATVLSLTSPQRRPNAR